MATATGLGVGFLFLILIMLGIASMVFWIVEIVDVSRREFRDPNNKVIWLLVIIFLHFLGALLYYFIGKSQGTLPGERRYTQY
jgi:hypothetical protein